MPVSHSKDINVVKITMHIQLIDHAHCLHVVVRAAFSCAHKHSLIDCSLYMRWMDERIDTTETEGGGVGLA